MTYQQAVKDAAAALIGGEDANWELARLTYENTNRKGERHKATHDQWSTDVRESSGRRFSGGTSGHYARMWERFGETTIVVSWTEAWYELVPRDASEPMRARAAKTHVGEGDPAEVAETVREALKRPEVAKAVVADDASNLAITKARQDHDAEARTFGELKDPERKRARHYDEQREALHKMGQFQRWLRESHDRWREWAWSQDLRDEWVETIEGLRMELDITEADPDLDSELKELTA